jgi:hypothetical protein
MPSSLRGGMTGFSRVVSHGSHCVEPVGCFQVGHRVDLTGSFVHQGAPPADEVTTVIPVDDKTAAASIRSQVVSSSNP